MKMLNNRPEKRTREISIRVNDDEFEKLHERRGALSLAKFLRNLGLGAPAIRKADADLVRALGRIGSNLNQIARYANTHKELDQNVLSEISAIREVLADLIKQNLKGDG